MLRLRLGTVTGPDPQRAGTPLTLSLEELQEHLLLIGRTGSGKTRILQQLIREHLEQRVALVLLDPDNDLVDDVLAYVTRRDGETGGDRLLKRLHVLELSPYQAFKYDPFHFHLPRPVHPELLPSVRAAWTHARVNQVAQILQRGNGQADLDGMPRLARVLTDVLTAVSALVDGRHLPLADAAVLLEIHSEAGQRAYRKVAHLLPRAVRADFEAWAQMRRVEDLRKETESTLNRLRLIFGPLLQSMFGTAGDEPGFHLFGAIQKGHVVLVSLRETPFFSADQARVLGQLLLYDTWTTAILTPRAMRRPVTLMIDEAHELISPDISTILRRGRKYLLSLVLASQSLSSFRKEDVDYRPMVLGQPRTVISMQQRDPDSLDLLARVLYTGSLKFDVLYNEVERDGGTEFVPVVEHTYSDQTGTTWTDTAGWQRSRSRTDSTGDSQTETAGWQHGVSDQEQSGSARTRGTTRSSGNSRGTHESPRVEAGQLLDMLHLVSEQESDQFGEQEGSTDTRSHSRGVSDGVSGGTSRAVQRGTAVGSVVGESGSRAEGGSASAGHSVAHRFAQVRRVVRELQRTGALEMSVADQLMQFAQRLFRLDRRQAVVLAGAELLEVEAIDVPDPFFSQNAIVRAAEVARRRLMEYRPYLFVPDLSPEEAERRLAAFLDDVVGAARREEAAEPAEDAEHAETISPLL